MISRRRRLGLGLLATTIAAALLAMAPAQAAEGDPDLAVGITALTPTVLTDSSGVTMSGTVTNNNDHAWTNMQAYLVIPTAPFTTRAQLESAVEDGAAYTGSRITEIDSISQMGDLAPGETASFRIEVPRGTLAISGAEGVYPVGVQILATDEEGLRSNDAIGRATTFLPLVADDRDQIPTTVVWPFLMPDHRGVDDTYADPLGLAQAVGPGGQLRNLLDLAVSTPARASTALIDPAILVGVSDLADGRGLPDDVELTEQQGAEAQRFLDDLLAFARRGSTWVLDYDRPDTLALQQDTELAGELTDAIGEATRSSLAQFQLSGRRASWPSRDGVTSDLLRSLRGSGDAPVIVSSAAVPDWDRRLGSVVRYETPSGPVPLVVNDALDDGVPGRTSVVTVRQRLLGEAALATLQRSIDPESRADAVSMVDPAWDPGPQWAEARLADAFTAAFVRITSLDDQLTSAPASYDGRVPTTAKAEPLGRSLLTAAAMILDRGDALSSVVTGDDGVDARLSRDVAEVLGLRWRGDQELALDIAEKRSERSTAELAKIEVEGPPSVTLSSSRGGFPLTIRNGTGSTIQIGVDLESSNPALTIPAVEPVEIGAGERLTLTVDIDLERQNTTTLTARLRSADGASVGSAAVFNVRSSSVGVVLWVAMGLAALLVLAALLRRFRRRRTVGTPEPLADDD